MLKIHYFKVVLLLIPSLIGITWTWQENALPKLFIDMGKKITKNNLNYIKCSTLEIQIYSKLINIGVLKISYRICYLF